MDKPQMDKPQREIAEKIIYDKFKMWGGFAKTITSAGGTLIFNTIIDCMDEFLRSQDETIRNNEKWERLNKEFDNKFENISDEEFDEWVASLSKK